LTLPPDQLVARRDLEDSNVLDLKTARALARTAALARAEIALEAVDAVVAASRPATQAQPARIMSRKIEHTF
jgi:hypothetical protein